MMRYAFILLTLFATPAIASDNLFDDPALEQRARTLFAELRCVVCEGQ